MITALNLIALVVLIGLIYAGIRIGLRTYLRYRGQAIVTCPESRREAGVKVDAWHAAITALGGGARLRLQDCSRWPEHQGCDQACLTEIEHSPEDCLLRSILQRWYDGKVCVLCSRPIGEIHWSDNKPGLMGPDREILGWERLQPEQIGSVLATHRPVCFDCHVAETFRRRFPELVVDRTARGPRLPS